MTRELVYLIRPTWPRPRTIHRMTPSPFRAIPSVEKLLRALEPLDLPRPSAVAVIRRELAALRAEKTTRPLTPTAVLARVRAALNHLRAGRIQTVINGTGVVLHTNLGRAPLAAAAIDALTDTGANYNNLEYDLAAGERGGRAAYLEHNLALLSGAEAATVVNNCAAALVLMLRHFTRGAKKEVVISRGELVQIGGGFRIPEILEASGARLREVGTTNRTTLDDYAAALGPETALILKVHRSNFYQGGFTGSPAVAELAALARKRRVPLRRRPRQRRARGHGRTRASRTRTHPRRSDPRRRGPRVFQRGQTASAARRRVSSRDVRGGSRRSSANRFSAPCAATNSSSPRLQATTDLYLDGRKKKSPRWR